MKRKNLISIVSALCLISFIIGGSFVYLVYGQTASTFWITEGQYPIADFTIWSETTNYFAKNSYGELLYASTNASYVTQSVIDSIENFDYVKCVGALYIDTGLIFNASTGQNLWGKVWTFEFDRLILTSATEDAITIYSCRWTFEIIGNALEVQQSWDNTGSLIKLDGTITRGVIDIGWVIGDIDDGQTTGLHWDLGNNDYVSNVDFRIGKFSTIKHALHVEMVGSSWASINDVDLGDFEGQTPQQILIEKSGTDAFHQNVIKGNGGAILLWNPQGVTETYTIKMTGNAKIVHTTFRDFTIYDVQNASYLAGSNVVGTTFITSAPRHQTTAFWHDSGNSTAFIACTITDETSATVFNLGGEFPTYPLDGEFYYHLTNHTLWIYNSTDWVSLTP